MQENLTLYEQLETTPVRFTTKQTTGAQLTSINAQYQVRKMTEIFGPVGVGWGFELTHSEIVEGGVILAAQEAQDQHGFPPTIGHEKVHTARIRLWYIPVGHKPGEENRCWIEATGHTKFVYRTKNGIFTDEDYEKKSITDAMTKAMSLLGMGGDVRMGLYDDSAYKSYLEQEGAIETAVDQQEAMAQAEEEFRGWYAKIREQIQTATTQYEREKLLQAALIRLSVDRRFSTPEYEKQIQAVSDERAKELYREES